MERLDEILAELAKLGETRTWEPGTTVVAEGDVARRRGVQTQTARGEFNEILSGLKAGELLIVSGTTKVADGRKVQTQPAAAAPNSVAR